MTQALTVEQVYNRMKANARPVTVAGKDHWVVEGDLLLDETELLAYAARIAALDKAPEPLPGVQKEPLLGMVDDSGRIIRWRKGLVLTYKVMRWTFPEQEQYNAIVLAMRMATSAWEAACGVNFQHLGSLDNGSAVQSPVAGSPPEFGERAIFQVSFGDFGGEFIAVAFFPNDPIDQRVVYIDPSYFSPDLSFDPVGVLRHELGHVLGFRHEHIRGGAPAGCGQEGLDGTIELTTYDSKSVMHYLCGGVGDPDLLITEFDRLGAREVYGPPDSEVTYFE